MSAARKASAGVSRRELTLVLGDDRAGHPGVVVVRAVEDALAVLRSGRVDHLCLEPGPGRAERAFELVEAMVAGEVWPRRQICVGAAAEPHAAALGALVTRGGQFAPVVGNPLRFRRDPARQVSASRPVLLLDVDGVLCPFGSPTARLHSAIAGGQSVRYDPALSDALQRLGDAFELVWATGWEHAANDCIAPLFGLPRLPVISFTDGYAVGDSWKLAAIQRFVGARVCAWVDDAIGADAHAWAAHRSVPTLFVDVDPHTGLGQGDVQRLLDFADDLTSGRTARAGTPA